MKICTVLRRLTRRRYQKGSILGNTRMLLCRTAIAGINLFLGAGISAAQDITSNLVAYWPFTNINGTFVADESGNGYNAAIVGRPYWTVGKLNGALHFGGVSDYAVATSSVVNTSQSFTAAAWVEIENLNNFATALSQDGNNVSGFYLQYTASGTFAFAMLSSDSSSATPTRATSPFTPITYTWYHLVGVYDSVNNVIELYVNGSLVATQPVPPAWNAGGPAAIGRAKFNAAPSDFWPGRITDARVYSRALTAQDVLTLYQTAPVDSPIRAPAVPLIVRGPYINTWDFSDPAPGSWATFWTGHVTAITGIAVVDGTGYTFFGAPSIPNLSNQMQEIQLEVTPTQSR
jgi:hypothetical protein